MDWIGKDRQSAIQRLRLADMRAGERGTVVDILAGAGLERRLAAMGIRPGVTIERTAVFPFDGPVVIGIGHVRLAIGRGMACKVIVEARKIRISEQSTAGP